MNLTDEDIGLIRAALRVAVKNGSPHLRTKYLELLDRIEQLPPKHRRERNRKTPASFQAKWLKLAIAAGHTEEDLNFRAAANGLTLKQVCEAVLK